MGYLIGFVMIIIGFVMIYAGVHSSGPNLIGTLTSKTPAPAVPTPAGGGGTFQATPAASGGTTAAVPA